MKFGGIIPVCNEWRFLPAVAGQLLKVCDRVIVLHGEKAFSGGQFERLPVPDLDPRIRVVSGYWASESSTRNAGIEMMQDCDYIFTLDSDEVICDRVLSDLVAETQRGHAAIACYLKTYWKSHRYTTCPPDRIPAVVVVRKDQRFKYMRVFDGEPHVLKGNHLIHHLSFVRTDDEVREKVRLYGHSHQISDDWFRRWKMWDEMPQLTHLHPVNPASIATIRPSPRDDVEELDKIFQEHGVVPL